MNSRSRQAETSRKKILDAAHDLISERGYENITVSEIMETCGMSVGNFYHYFKAKEDLITALEREAYEHANQELSLMGRLPIERQLRYYVMNWAQTETLRHSSPNFGRQWFIHQLSRPTDFSDGDNKINIMKNEIVTCFERAIENGELRGDTPVELLAYSLSFEIIGTYLFFIMTRASFPMLEWAGKYCDKCLGPMLAPYYV